MSITLFNYKERKHYGFGWIIKLIEGKGNGDEDAMSKAIQEVRSDYEGTNGRTYTADQRDGMNRNLRWQREEALNNTSLTPPGALNTAFEDAKRVEEDQPKETPEPTPKKTSRRDRLRRI
jgi:hypothetical protein